jgi:SAM-dependent methyltransferase
VAVRGETDPARTRLGRHLLGSGIEIGPGPYPFRELSPDVTVRFVDRWESAEHEALTSQPGPGAKYVEPDVIADFNTDRLGFFADASEDFVIASHVLEHLADPIGFIAEIHRVLRPGGVTLVLLPDRHRTEDRFRRPTPLDHLVAEFRAGVTEVSDDHLIEFMKDRGKSLRGSAEDRRAALETMRKKSIHVHCWDAEEFLPVLLWGIEELGQQWELVDACQYEAPIRYEFGYLLRRSNTVVDPATRKEQFESAWRTWHHAQMALRPVDFENKSQGHLQAWTYQQARRLVRRYRLPAWAYRQASRFAGR